MARVEGKNAKGLFARFVYSFYKKMFGKVPEPLRIAAHHDQVFRAHIGMEKAQQKAGLLDDALKTLVNLRVAMQIGCPF